jgi:dTDP-4-dehydrorhamnose 3,5-epimerase
MEFFTLEKLKTYKLIKDVITRPLKVNKDPRGILIETLKTDWSDIYDSKNLPFTQNYFSVTKSNVARDEDRWHVHPLKQRDRFVVAQGKILVALYDNRKNSSTYGLLNLFLMGELEKDVGYYNLLVPKKVLHCFLVVSKKPALIMNFPTALYDPKEEGRIAFKKVKLSDGTYFSWNKIRKKLKLPAKS